MDSDQIIGVLELGTFKLKCVIAKKNSDFTFDILGAVLCDSKGIHNGTIINLSEATKAIRFCISEAEKKANITLKNVNIIIEPREFLCTRISKYRKIGGSKIQNDDIAFLLKEGKNQIKLNYPNNSIVHIFNYNYFVDGKIFYSEPSGVYADIFQHEMTFITSPINILRNINQVLVDCDIEIGKFISGSYALGAESLKSTDLDLGSTIIDIGYEKTSLAIFNNSALIHSISIPIGIHHLTKDISRGCSLTLEESEEIKNKLDIIDIQNITQKNDNNDYLPEFFFKDSKFRKISKFIIETIVKARIEEIFKLLKDEIYFTRLHMTAGKNILITGGGSNLINIDKFCKSFFSANVRIIDNNIQKFKYKDSDVEKDNFNACLGALKIINSGFDTEAISQKPEPKKMKLGIFSRFFG